MQTKLDENILTIGTLGDEPSSYPHVDITWTLLLTLYQLLSPTQEKSTSAAAEIEDQQ